MTEESAEKRAIVADIMAKIDGAFGPNLDPAGDFATGMREIAGCAADEVVRLREAVAGVEKTITAPQPPLEVLAEIRAALAIACEHDPGLASFPDEPAVMVRQLVQRNAQLRELVEGYKRLVADAGTGA